MNNQTEELYEQLKNENMVMDSKLKNINHELEQNAKRLEVLRGEIKHLKSKKGCC